MIPWLGVDQRVVGGRGRLWLRLLPPGLLVLHLLLLLWLLLWLLLRLLLWLLLWLLLSVVFHNCILFSSIHSGPCADQTGCLVGGLSLGGGRGGGEVGRRGG